MEHLDQIQRAVDYIEDHLNDDLHVDVISKVAGFSRWHFQTVFSAAVGDSLKEYIRTRRLTKAMSELGTDKRILDIALDAGFESQESFTRAFKNMFKATPGECRKAGINPMHLKKIRITIEYLDHLYGGINMEPVYKSIPEMKIVGCLGKFISVLSPDKNNMVVIPALWQSFMPRLHEVKNAKSSVNLGVCYEVLPAEVSRPDECMYMAATEVTTFDNVPEGMKTFTIPAGEYAIFTHKGPLDTFEHTMNYIYGSWLPKSGKKLRHAPDIEWYDKRFKLNEADSEIDVYIPVE
ncbi:MAG: GyrI-like domain-containing protein [Rhizobacter sp.]|nr:GyrI-like domain-containing protein [Bacteriovorax sp.]